MEYLSISSTQPLKIKIERILGQSVHLERVLLPIIRIVFFLLITLLFMAFFNTVYKLRLTCLQAQLLILNLIY